VIDFRLVPVRRGDMLVEFPPRAEFEGIVSFQAYLRKPEIRLDKAVGSSADGRIVDTLSDIRAFQPFFLDFQPPSSLTAGDEISLPLNVRNYIDTSVSVETTVDGRSGIEIVGAPKIAHSLSGGQNRQSSVRVRAAEPSRSATVTATAIGAGVSDAMERKLSIRPDGRQVFSTINQNVAKIANVGFAIPDHPLAGTLSGRIRLYPTLLSHIYDGREPFSRVPGAARNRRSPRPIQTCFF
jgi:uncharacterized protein YfaS (alpha-2-macroglobulin family)